MYASSQPRARHYESLPRRKRNPTGRVDVLVYRMALRGLEHLEQRGNLPGLAEALRPSLDKFVREMLPARPLFRLRRRPC